jgi:CCR4-NOT complex subunit CAF16
MDVLGRLQLLRFFKQECEERQCIILLATHIFDGLKDWMTHVALVSDGKLLKGGPVEDFPELHEGKVWLFQFIPSCFKCLIDCCAALQVIRC